MATPIGFEPTISTVTGWRVRPLHHGAASAYVTVRAGVAVVNGGAPLSPSAGGT